MMGPMGISESFARKFMIASLAVAFATLVTHSMLNRRWHFVMVHAEREAAEPARAEISVITRVARAQDAPEVRNARVRELSALGWRVVGSEITTEEDYHDHFRAVFRDAVTEAPYLSYNDADGHEVRAYFYEGPLEKPLLLEHRAALEKQGVRDLKTIGLEESA